MRQGEAVAARIGESLLFAFLAAVVTPDITVGVVAVATDGLAPVAPTLASDVTLVTLLVDTLAPFGTDPVTVERVVPETRRNRVAQLGLRGAGARHRRTASCGSWAWILPCACASRSPACKCPQRRASSQG